MHRGNTESNTNSATLILACIRIKEAYGGDAEEAGWTFSPTSTAVIAVSLISTPVLAGSGVLMQLVGEITSDCIVDIYVSDRNGLEVLYDLEILILPSSSMISSSDDLASTMVSTSLLRMYSSLEDCEALSSCNSNSTTRCLPTMNAQYTCPLDTSADG